MSIIPNILSKLHNVTQSGDGWTACCPAHDDQNPSLSIRQTADGKILLHCFAGCDYGNIVKALQSRGIDFPNTSANRPAPRPKLDARARANIERMGREITDDDGTIAAYLRSRGLSGQVPPALRLHPSLSYWREGRQFGTYPAMVAAVTAPDGETVTYHRTYLERGGAGKADVPAAKKMMPPVRDGATRGAAIRLTEATGEVLALAEGIETALAVHETTGLPTWATISAGGMAAVKLPRHVTTVWIWADHDRDTETRRGAGQEAAETLAARLRAEGRTVHLLLPPEIGTDWLDVLATDGADAVTSAYETAEPWEPPLNAESEQSGTDPLAALTDLDEAADLPTIERALRKIAMGLAGADKLTLTMIREQIIDELERRRVKRPAGMADAALSLVATAGGTDSGQGTSIIMSDPEPWPEPVDGAKLLDEIEHTFTRFLALPVGASVALAVWVLHTYVYGAFVVTPRLAFTSATKRCGKTTAQTLTSRLVARPLTTANITTAALFRAVEAYAPTILIDEADMFLEEREELRGLLNAGHFRPSAHVIRTVGDDHEVRLFSVWAPACVALIGKLPSTLYDRSIEIQMRRKTPDEKVERLRIDRMEDVENIRRKAARWAQDNFDALRVLDPHVPEELHDRAADNWRPLLAIADHAGGDWPERARQAALVLSGAAEESGDGDIGPELLTDIYYIFQARKADRLSSSDILKGLIGSEGRPWATWRRGQPLNAHQLARLLEPFGIRPKKFRFEQSTRQGYERTMFDDAWNRYPPPVRRDSESEHPEQPHNHALFSDSANRNTKGNVPLRKSAANPHHDAIVPGVPLSNPGSEKREVFTL